MRSTSTAGEGQDHQFRHRRKKKVSLLLPPISIQTTLNSSTNYVSTASRFRYFAILSVVVGSVVFLSKNANNQQQVTSSSWDANMKQLTGSSRPFQYIGDLSPSEPLPWPEEEADWHALHKTLVNRVKESDALPIINQGDDYLPQLVFYGDSITEGWNGTSFGNLPGPHRMWADGEDETIRDVFANAFGDKSEWGERVLKPPLILGISGSRTYDFIWRVKNGEFPVSPLLTNVEIDTTDGDGEFHTEKLERIYILLMGTNNLGGGMLPGPTLEGMDAAGRTILQLHEKHFPNTPAAMLFSELLPRNDDFRAAKMCPPRCKNLETLEPFKSFMPAINKVNRELPGLLDEWRKEFKNSRIVLLSASEVNTSDQSNNVSYNTVIYCGGEMFSFDDINELDIYMPDRLHPNAKGYELWSWCLKKGLDAVMS